MSGRGKQIPKHVKQEALFLIKQGRMTLEQISRKLGVHPSTINRYASEWRNPDKKRSDVRNPPDICAEADQFIYRRAS